MKLHWIHPALFLAAALSAAAQSGSDLSGSDLSGSDSEPAAEQPTQSYETVDPRAKTLSRVGFQDKLNTQLPLDLSFRNEQGKMVTLGDYLGNGRPVVLSLVYYECPAFCNILLNGFVQGAKDVAATGDKFKIGGSYDVITVSFDHEETHVLAAEKKANYLKELGQPGAEQGWHFLVGNKENIDTLCEAVGFSFEYDPKTDEYAHRAGLLVLTESGVISRYLAGVMFPAKDLSFALIDAGEGNIGSFTSKLFAGCYRFDPTTGKYTPVVNQALLIGCVLTVVLMAVFLTRLIRFDLRRQEAFAAADSGQNNRQGDA